MEQPIETIEYKGHTIKIFPDDPAENPFEMFDRLSDPCDMPHAGDLTPMDIYQAYGNGVCDYLSFRHADTFFFITVDKLRKEYGDLPMAQLKAKGREILKAEMKTYRQWAEGEVYGYEVEGPLCDHSCWGFYGFDHEKSGLLETAKEEIDYAVKTENEAKEFEQTAMAL